MDASCQCGAVAFKTPLKKPLALYICHCDECRRQSTSAFGCSAIFPMFPLPCKENLSCYSRPTLTGDSINCYFCTTCGTRVIHSTPGKDIVSIKGGCIEGLDWSNARHIWASRAMVPIPEGVERDEKDPKVDVLPTVSSKDGKYRAKHELQVFQSQLQCQSKSQTHPDSQEAKIASQTGQGDPSSCSLYDAERSQFLSTADGMTRDKESPQAQSQLQNGNVVRNQDESYSKSQSFCTEGHKYTQGQEAERPITPPNRFKLKHDEIGLVD